MKNIKSTRNIVPLKLIFIALIGTLMLSACSELNNAPSEEYAKQIIENMFLDFQSLNFEQAKKYVNIEEIETFINKEFETMSIGSNQFMNEWFDTLSCEIVSASVVNDSLIEVYTKVHTRDMNQLFQEQNEMFDRYCDKYINENINALRTLSESELYKHVNDIVYTKTKEFFKECLQSNNYDTITTSVNIRIEKNDDCWYVVVDDEFLNAILGDWEGTKRAYAKRNNIDVTN